MGLFRRKRRDPEPTTPEPDLYERTRDDLWAKAADSPGLAALLTEIERGRERRQGGPMSDAVEDDVPTSRCACAPGQPSINSRVAVDLGDGYRVYEIGVNGYLALHHATGLGSVASSPSEAVEQIRKHRGEETL